MGEHKECKRLLRSLTEYLDGELEETLCQELEKHLADCENCQVVVNTTRMTIDLVHQNQVPSTLPEDIRSRLFYRLDLQDYLKKDAESQ